MRKTVHEKIKLTDAKVRSFKPPIDRPSIIVWDSEQTNFGVRVTSNGAKSWIVRLKVDGKAFQTTIGKCDVLPIRCVDERGKENGARHRAKLKLLEIADGINPQEAKKKKSAQKMTLGEVKAEYVANKRTKNGPLRPNSIKDIENCISEWDDLPVAKITRSMCLTKFNEISVTAPVQANLDFRNLRAILNRARELTATEDGQYTILTTNPVTHLFRKNGLVKWNPVGKRKTKIPEDKVGAVFNLLEQLADQKTNTQTMYTCADLVLFLLFTGCRIGEARSLTWNNVDLDSIIPTFHLSSDTVKNHNAVTLPISSALATVMRRRFIARKKHSDFVFPAIVGKTGYVADPRALFKKVSKAAGVKVHPHALRRTFEFIALTTGVDSDQRRLLLNHISGDVHATHYSNADEPSALLPAVEKVGRWVIEQGKVAKAQNVATVGFTQSEVVS